VIPSTSRRLPYGSHNLNSLLAKMLSARGVVLAQDIAAAEAAVETIKIKCMRAAGAEAGGAAAGGGPAGGEEAQAAPEVSLGRACAQRRREGAQAWVEGPCVRGGGEAAPGLSDRLSDRHCSSARNLFACRPMPLQFACCILVRHATPAYQHALQAHRRALPAYAMC
jgi:hypothetical protein